MSDTDTPKPLHRTSEDGSLELLGQDGNYHKAPEHLLSRLAGRVAVAAVATTTPGSLPGVGGSMTVNAESTMNRYSNAATEHANERASFLRVTQADPGDWLDKLRSRKILERGPTTDKLYALACKLTGQTPNEFETL